MLSPSKHEKPYRAPFDRLRVACTQLYGVFTSGDYGLDLDLAVRDCNPLYYQTQQLLFLSEGQRSEALGNSVTEASEVLQRPFAVLFTLLAPFHVLGRTLQLLSTSPKLDHFILVPLQAHSLVDVGFSHPVLLGPHAFQGKADLLLIDLDGCR